MKLQMSCIRLVLQMLRPRAEGPGWRSRLCLNYGTAHIDRTEHVVTSPTNRLVAFLVTAPRRFGLSGARRGAALELVGMLITTGLPIDDKYVI